MFDLNKLNWQPNPAGVGGEMACIKFENGYEASVLRGGLFYTDNGTYEVAVMKDGYIDNTTPITDGVLGYLSENELKKALYDISNLQAKGE